MKEKCRLKLVDDSEGAQEIETKDEDIIDIDKKKKGEKNGSGRKETSILEARKPSETS